MINLNVTDSRSYPSLILGAAFIGLHLDRLKSYLPILDQMEVTGIAKHSSLFR
jgi:hypothetical protein